MYARSTYLEKALLIGITVFFALCLIPDVGRTQEEAIVRVIPSVPYVGPGHLFSVNVTYENIPAKPGAAGCQFFLTWNASVLRCLSITEIGFTRATPPLEQDNIWTLALKYNNSAGSLLYAVTWQDVTKALSRGYAPITGNGTWASMTFNATGAGRSYLALTSTLIGDPDGNSVPLTAVNSSIEIQRPSIESVGHNPLIPGYDTDVEVSAHIIAVPDSLRVDKAFLSYRVGSIWLNVSMNQSGDIFSAAVPRQPYGTFVQYKVLANDTKSNYAESVIFNYTIKDFKPPDIIGIMSRPLSPDPYVDSGIARQYEPTLISANVTEPADASGVSNVILSFTADGVTWTTTLPYNATTGLWSAQIPGYQANTHCRFWISAIDKAGNSRTSDIYGFDVQQLPVGDVNGNGIVDIYDVIIVASHFGQHYP